MLVFAAAAYMAISIIMLIVNSRKRKRKERLSITYGPIEERDRMRIEYLDNKIWKNDTSCVNMLRLGKQLSSDFVTSLELVACLLTLYICVWSSK